jgi:cyclophilin family peptidyl-prolyl cis-trans isomerase
MSYTATITTDNGDIVLELFSDVPITTNNFVFLACQGYYDGLTFHRVLPGFVAQGGDPTGSGSGGPGYQIPDEDDGDHTFDEAGVISMAKAGPDTTGSQFFITYAATPDLEANFTVFGQVTAGTDVLEQITPRDPSTDPNAPPGDTIATITIEEQ